VQKRYARPLSTKPKGSKGEKGNVGNGKCYWKYETQGTCIAQGKNGKEGSPSGENFVEKNGTK